MIVPSEIFILRLTIQRAELQDQVYNINYKVLTYLLGQEQRIEMFVLHSRHLTIQRAELQDQVYTTLIIKF